MKRGIHIYFGSRICIRLTMVDPLFYNSIAIFGACVLADRVIGVSDTQVVPKQTAWEDAIDGWINELKRNQLRDVVDVLCIKNTLPGDTWKHFTEPEEEAKKIAALTYLFQHAARIQGVKLQVFPYEYNVEMIERVQTYIEDIKGVQV